MVQTIQAVSSYAAAAVVLVTQEAARAKAPDVAIRPERICQARSALIEDPPGVLAGGIYLALRAI